MIEIQHINTYIKIKWTKTLQLKDRDYQNGFRKRSNVVYNTQTVINTNMLKLKNGKRWSL